MRGAFAYDLAPSVSYKAKFRLKTRDFRRHKPDVAPCRLMRNCTPHTFLQHDQSLENS